MTSLAVRALDRAAVQRYRGLLLEAGLAPSTINQKLSAIRAPASEAADNGLLDQQLAAGVARVKGVPSAGTRTGNWLRQVDAQRLLDAPDPTTREGVRDRAILAVVLGCRLRRSEIAALTLAHVQQRDGRWVIVDLVGKHHRVRSVPAPNWTRVAIDAWTERAGISEGRGLPLALQGPRRCIWGRPEHAGNRRRSRRLRRAAPHRRRAAPLPAHSGAVESISSSVWATPRSVPPSVTWAPSRI